MWRLLRFCSMILALVMVGSIYAQSTITVPDVRGLSLPNATAELNRVGLRVGAVTNIEWWEDSGYQANQVNTQLVAPDSTVDAGTKVDLTVVRQKNIELLYDDNDLTMKNLSSFALNLEGVLFDAEESDVQLQAMRWSKLLREGQCTQVWTVNRNGPKDVEGCNYIQTWFSTTNSQEHFWTELNDVYSFYVMQNGLPRGRCTAAPPGSQDVPSTCQFYLDSNGAEDSDVPFIYFAYTPGALVILNRADNQWMPTADASVVNNNPSLSKGGVRFNLVDFERFDRSAVVGDIARLAPNQCLLYLRGQDNNGSAPIDCDVLASTNLSSAEAFWLLDFEVNSLTDGQKHICPGATQDKTTICVLPR